MSYIVQHHKADRAGPHYDVRFGDKDTGLLSWASRKGVPQPGEKHLAVQQPVHRHGYKDFEGEIPEGYGKGTVKKHTEGQVLITKVTPESIHFTTAHQRHPERFTLARPKGWGDKNWLMMNTTPRDEVPYEKVRYKKIPADQVEPHLKNMQQGDTAEAKVDGASQLVQLAKGHAEMLSFRTSKTTGRPIFHTERFFGGRPDIKVPKHLEGSILKGEMYAAHDGKAGTPQDVGTLLNSSIAHSLQLQKERGLQLRNMLYDVQQYGKKPIDPSVTPRADRRKMLEEILTHLPQDKFHASEEAHGPEEATKLWDTVRSGQHPLTEEGIVMHPRVGVPSKAKLVEEHDVHLTGTFPGEGKRQATVGGFTYGHEPGKTVGKVGTGFSDDFLKEVARDPGAYTGRVARLRAQQKLPSGALRAPSFIGLHEDINKVAGAGWFGSFWDPAPGIPEEPVDPGTASYLDTDIRRRRRPVQPIPPPTWTDTMRDALWGRPNAIVPEILKTIEEEEKIAEAHSVLADLKRAKSESDRGNYKAKHQILSKLLDEHPGAFVQDSTSGSMIGLTHPATGFKIHAPAQVVRGRAMLAPIYHGSATAVRVKAARSADESEVRRLIKAISKADLYGAWYNAIENKARVSMGDWSETGGHLVHRALSSVLGEDNVEVEAEIGPPWDEGRKALAAGWVKLAKADNVSTLPDGRVLDIGKLIDKSKGRRVERIPIDDVPKPSRSEASGYSKARQAKVDMSKPVIVGTDGTLYDGRHRLFRHIDEGETHIRAVRVSDVDIDDVTICDDCKLQGDKIDKNRIEMLPAKAAMAKLADLLPWVHLQPQQERVAKKVREGQNLLVYHGLGSGKSLAGIAAAEGVGGPYTAVVPASLRPNYQGEIAKFTNRTTPSEVLSYTGVGMGRQPEQDPDTIIMDEVQRLRNPESAGSQAAMDLAMRAKHKVLLSGTPIVNQPSDLAVPLSILTGDRMSPATFTNKFVGTKTVDPGWMGWLQGVKPAKVPTIKDEQGLEKLLENHVDYQPSRTPEGVKTRDERVEVDLSPEQQDFYKLMWGKLPWMTRWKLSNDYPLTGPELSHLSAFMTGPRQAALSLYPYHSSKDPMRAFQTSAKLQSAMGSLKKTLGKDPRAKALVYSNFIDAGLTPYSAALKAEGIPFGQFHGTMTEEDRKQALSDYNSGKLRVLLLGPAAAEGISAKGTQLIQLLDPHWNEARLGQARGRGLRFDSHEGLPPELRNVRIQRFVAKMPKPGWLGRLFGDTERPSADEILEHQSERKEELNEQFREVLRRVGSPGYKRPWSLFG